MSNSNPSPATRFQPGNPGSPTGRTGRPGLVSLLKDALERAKNGEGGGTKAEDLADAIIDHAISGKGQYANLILDRIEGKIGSKSVQEQQAPPLQCIIYLPCKDGEEHTATHYEDRNGRFHARDGSPDPSDTYEVGDDGRNPGLFADESEATDGTATQGS